MSWILRLYKRLPRDAKRHIKQAWFELLSTIDSGDDVIFLNHGYANHKNPTLGLDLQPEDEPHRYSIQLYDRIASGIEWKGLRGLEISCGRGGGAAYVQRYLAPESLIGLDITASAIRFCERHYEIPGLSFRRGAAEDLPFPDASFDVVLNVESSVLYGDGAAFFREARRVLKPGGLLLYGDYRKRSGVRKWRERVANSGLENVLVENLTDNVIAATQIEADAKRKLVMRHAPRFLRSIFTRFAGGRDADNSEIELRQHEKRVWLRFVLRKPLEG